MQQGHFRRVLSIMLNEACVCTENVLKEAWACDSNRCGLLAIRGLFSTLCSVLPESDFFVLFLVFLA